MCTVKSEFVVKLLNDVIAENQHLHHVTLVHDLVSRRSHAAVIFQEVTQGDLRQRMGHYSGSERKGTIASGGCSEEARFLARPDLETAMIAGIASSSAPPGVPSDTSTLRRSGPQASDSTTATADMATMATLM